MELTADAGTVGENPASQPRNTLTTIYSRLRVFSLSAYDRLDYGKTAVVLGFIAGLLLSHRLWVSTRTYPLIPAIPGLRPIPYPYDYFCAVVLLLLLWSIALSSRPRPYIFGFAALLIFLGLLDQTRWQPWAYLYLFILLALASSNWKREDTRSQENALNICRLLVVATYFYSGLQKMNHHFAAIAVVSMLGPRASHLPLLHLWPWMMAAVEISLAIGLLTRKYRNLAVICAIGMHMFILFSNIVIHVWNSVVWPWNITMMAFLVVFFWNSDASFAEIVWRNPMPLQKFVLLLFGILPFFSFFGLWDSYLSASLYSANVPEARVVFRGNVKNQLPARVQKSVETLPAATYMLNIGKWSLDELNVPPYPAMRVYRAVAAEVCKYADNSPDVVLLMRDKDTWLQQSTQTQDTCLSTINVRKW